jgi:hypothetical protein
MTLTSFRFPFADPNMPAVRVENIQFFYTTESLCQWSSSYSESDVRNVLRFVVFAPDTAVEGRWGAQCPLSNLLEP